MRVWFTIDSTPDARRASRQASKSVATLKDPKQTLQFIQLLDISREGCGFSCAQDLTVGTLVSLGLPGLGKWPARIMWFRGRRGGLKFVTPLDERVAKRLSM